MHERPVPQRADGLALARRHARALIDTMVAVQDDGDLRDVLGRLVQAACVLTDARYGALAVLGPDQRVGTSVTHGVPDRPDRGLWEPPGGRGVLRLLVDDPRPLRLHDLAAHPAAAADPPRHPGVHTFLGVPVLVRSRVFGVLYLAHKRGGADFTRDDEELMVSLAAAAAVAIDNARQYHTGRHRQQWLEASVEIEQQLLAGMPRSAALALVCDRALALARADLVSILLPDGDDLVVHAASGRVAGDMRGARVPVGRSLTGAVLRAGAPEGVPDFRADSRSATLRGAPALGPARIVPMSARGHVLGVLLVARRPGASPLGEHDSAMVDAFARQAAIALELATSQVQRGTLAVYRDRERIARDLHDLVIQRIFGTGLTVQSMRPRLPQELCATADEVVGQLDEAIRDLRSAIFALQRPGMAEGLRGRLTETVSAAVPALGCEPRVRMEGPLDTVVPEPVAAHLTSVLTEALTNVARHAQAHAVQVLVSARTDALTLQVEDDGTGLSEGAVVPGNGLRNMRSRAAELGGGLSIRERPEGGTRLVWSVPLGPVRPARAGP
ncbi:GAF domain-containing protein [Cellulomonas sp. C5510]|uniref:sensor histidine kinase n=1 Tax=Cellulomonas sp. C5510 TaxID=2871170 RepID=UPI001C960E1C|nr:GAF domain-containing protein [Cellulomonas sp. C5510]QZN86982.1 GAF domain-containing protein [Cellulomonas sp. C5510]